MIPKYSRQQKKGFLIESQIKYNRYKGYNGRRE